MAWQIMPVIEREQKNLPSYKTEQTAVPREPAERYAGALLSCSEECPFLYKEATENRTDGVSAHTGDTEKREESKGPAQENKTTKPCGTETYKHPAYYIKQSA